MFPSCFVLVDPTTLARPDKDSMPQQMLMEILVGDFNDKRGFQDNNGDFKAICSWDGVECGDDGEVEYIEWDSETRLSLYGGDTSKGEYGQMHQGGSIDLRWIPLSVVQCCISMLELSGSIDTFCLPRELPELYLDGNRFGGTFNVVELPQKLGILNVSKNQLSGSLDLTKLPQALRIFQAYRNQFSGSIDLRTLPVSLENFSLEGNCLSGSIDLRFLPSTLYRCCLQNNKFQQEVVVLSSNRSKLVTLILDNGKFQSFVDTDGGVIRMSNGKFSGRHVRLLK
ncbi:leucine-rich repeat protein [Perkinsela sp. CCAP 1560/4]|nr:leucine-rich repeat protein [Perkinsela sp. CCAP 1560/4]|eukprot:KNH04137.1 leucine-rich repeat protein [Perkinsela sp. CCAP 1560/4]